MTPTNQVVQRGYRWNSHHHSSPTIATTIPHKSAGVRDERSPESPLIFDGLGFSVPGLGGSGSTPCGSTSDAWTMRRSAAEYFGLQVVRVSDARPGFDSSTSPSSGLTANGS